MTKLGFKQHTADSRARRRRGEPRFPLRRSRILSPQSGCSTDARAVGSARGAGGAPDPAREARPLPPRPEEDGVGSYPARRERAGQWHDRTTSGAQRRRPPSGRLRGGRGHRGGACGLWHRGERSARGALNLAVSARSCQGCVSCRLRSLRGRD